MVHTLTSAEAVDRLLSDHYANWSPAGARALVEHLEQIEDDIGEPFEFDAVAIRCDYSEYGSACDAAADLLGGVWSTDVEAVIALERHTPVIGVPGGGVIVQAF